MTPTKGSRRLNNKTQTATRSDKKRYDEYYRKSKSGKPLFVALVALREYGIFVIPLFPAYLLFYYVVFKNGGAEDGLRWLYVTLFLSILAVVVSGWFLRKMWRNHQFRKYTEMQIPVFKKNIWRCPFCGNENNLLSPCKVCGIFPELYKSEKDTPAPAHKKRSKKQQREFDEYGPQFK